MEIVLDHKEEAPSTSTKGFPQYVMVCIGNPKCTIETQQTLAQWVDTQRFKKISEELNKIYIFM
jgi:hypothetical protein